ncbi:hypothetical protein SAMN05421693_10962 [Ectothiorhodospira magna]|uniref:Uncharacterized protein n=1 Tax=Ectothiorhodospira magna TaxID=867345 RepID=A0A1H9BKR5_9GAMM|nr:hypothetical protein SAMN05421693_10962 [Ectothiorhodospira magna]
MNRIHFSVSISKWIGGSLVYWCGNEGKYLHQGIEHWRGLNFVIGINIQHSPENTTEHVGKHCIQHHIIACQGAHEGSCILRGIRGLIYVKGQLGSLIEGFHMECGVLEITLQNNQCILFVISRRVKLKNGHVQNHRQIVFGERAVENLECVIGVKTDNTIGMQLLCGTLNGVTTTRLKVVDIRRCTALKYRISSTTVKLCCRIRTCRTNKSALGGSLPLYLKTIQSEQISGEITYKQTGIKNIIAGICNTDTHIISFLIIIQWNINGKTRTDTVILYAVSWFLPHPILDIIIQETTSLHIGTDDTQWLGWIPIEQGIILSIHQDRRNIYERTIHEFWIFIRAKNDIKGDRLDCGIGHLEGKFKNCSIVGLACTRKGRSSQGIKA